MELQGSVNTLLVENSLERLPTFKPCFESLMSFGDQGEKICDRDVKVAIIVDWPEGIGDPSYWQYATATPNLQVFKWPQDEKEVTGSCYPLLMTVGNDLETNTRSRREKKDPFLQWEINVKGTRDAKLVEGLMRFVAILREVRSLHGFLRVAIPKTFVGHKRLVFTLSTLMRIGYLLKWVDDGLRWSDYLVFSFKRSKDGVSPVTKLAVDLGKSVEPFYNGVLFYLYRTKIVSYDLLLKVAVQRVREEKPP